MTDTDLARELATYEKIKQDLLAHQGKYVVIHGEKIIGIYDTYPDAMAAGYKECGLEPFLVKRIELIEQMHQFSRPLVIECRA